MEPLNTIEHLAAAEARDIPTPKIYSAAGQRFDAGSMYHYMDCNPAEDRVEVSYEDFPNGFFPTGSCKACWELAKDDAEFSDMYQALNSLVQLEASTNLFQEVYETLVELRCGVVIGASRWISFCSRYVLARQRLMPRADLAAGSIHMRTAELDPADPSNGPLVSYVIEAFQELTRKASRELDGTPVRDVLLASRPQAGTPQLRAVYPAPVGVSSAGLHDGQAEALISECTVLVPGERWRVVEWDSRLDQWSLEGSTADAELVSDLDPLQASRELELALGVYATDFANADFGDILAGVRAAHA